jgi:hypothetical protein
MVRGRAPPLDGLWKFLIHRILGFEGSAVPPQELRLKTVNLESEILDHLRLESESLRELLRPLDGEDEGLFSAEDAAQYHAQSFHDAPPPFSPPRRRRANPQAHPELLPPFPELPPPPEARPEKRASSGGVQPQDKAGFPPPGLAAFVKSLGATEREALRFIVDNSGAKGADSSDGADPDGGFAAWAKKNKLLPELLTDRINETFREFCGDLLIETQDEGPCILAEYRAELYGIFGGP